MSHTSQRLLRLGAFFGLAAASLLIIYRRPDGPAMLPAFGSALLIGLPVGGLGCLAMAVVSPRVRGSIRAHPLIYTAWAVAGVVAVCLLVSAVAATGKARYGH